jgi:hypothetical protein
METNETFEQSSPAPGIVLNFEAQSYLREAGRWAVFLGILGFIGTGLILICALFVSTFFALMAQYQPTPYPAGISGIVSFVYVLIAVFNFFFALYLYQFGSGIKKAILYNDTVETGKALEKLKSFFKLWGITTIVIIAIWALVIIISIVVGIGAASMMHR